MNQGSCQCNAVRYQFDGALFNCCYCHCSICRKLTGSTMGAYGTISKESFSWVEGEGLLSVYQQNSSLKRFFCSVCGSFLVSVHDLDPVNIFISLGSLSTSVDVDIQYQQFTSSKASWVSLAPRIKRHDEWPDWVYKKMGKSV